MMNNDNFDSLVLLTVYNNEIYNAWQFKYDV